MYCKNCGKQVVQGGEFCSNCGEKPLSGNLYCENCGVGINLSGTQEVCGNCGSRLSNNNSSSYNSYSSSAEQNLKPYYQEEFAKMRQTNEAYKGKWNWCAFFFSWIWGFTKGLWGPSVATLAVGILFKSSNSKFGQLLGLGMAVLWGIRGNYFYYNLQTKNKQFPDKL